MKTRSMRGGWLVLVAAFAAGCTDDDNNYAPGSCSVCSNSMFNCTTTEGGGGTMSVTTPESFGCSGAISGEGDAGGMWIHCDTQQVCVESATECYPAVLAANGFSYTWIAGTVTCNAL
jgi:hypothetical protein